MNKLGDLFIVVAKDKNIEDFFEIDSLEDEDAINFMWEMYKEE